MTKTPYEVRAYRFAAMLCKLFVGCQYLEDYLTAIKAYNKTHSMKLVYHFGVSRIAILRADYVVKFAMVPDEVWDNGDGSCRAGDNDTEYEVYQRAVRDGFAYLLAKTTPVVINGHSIAIMPRIDHVGDESRLWWECVTDKEYDWLTDNVNDLHSGNVGYRNGKPVVIDYAWDVEMGT